MNPITMSTLFTYLLWMTYFLVGLTGCSSVPNQPGKWKHPTNSQAMIRNDHYQCIDAAWKKYPKKAGAVLEGGHWESARNATSSCRYNKYSQTTNCTYTPASEGQWVGGTVVQGDQNAESRVNMYALCMYKKDSAYECMQGFETVDGIWCGKYIE